MFKAQEALLTALADALTARSQMLATAESCTGGLIAAACTHLAGSSNWFERGFVTYSNAAKHADLAVPMDVINQYGAVSGPVVKAMASGAVDHSAADWAVAVSGVAGPGGGSREKPVGTVWIGWAQQGKTAQAKHFLFTGDRQAVRLHTLNAALEGLLKRIKAP